MVFDITFRFDCSVFQTVEAFLDNIHSNSFLHADENTPFDALQTLADLSLMMPETADTGHTIVF